MTKTDYAWGMSTTPSDRDYINPKALEGFMRSFDHAINGKLGVESPEPPDLKELMVKYREHIKQLEQQAKARRPSFWYTFPPFQVILRIRDNIRLRRYNREWIKNNIH